MAVTLFLLVGLGVVFTGWLLQDIAGERLLQTRAQDLTSAATLSETRPRGELGSSSFARFSPIILATCRLAYLLRNDGHHLRRPDASRAFGFDLSHAPTGRGDSVARGEEGDRAFAAPKGLRPEMARIAKGLERSIETLRARERLEARTASWLSSPISRPTASGSPFVPSPTTSSSSRRTTARFS